VLDHKEVQVLGHFLDEHLEDFLGDGFSFLNLGIVLGLLAHSHVDFLKNLLDLLVLVGQGAL